MQDNDIKKEVTSNPEEQVKKQPKKEMSFLDKLKYDLYGMFIASPWHISMVLLMVPGLFIGLFMGSHITAIHLLPSGYENTSFYLFILILLGCISIFNGFSFSSKRSLFHAVFSLVITAILIVFAILYCLNFIKYGRFTTAVVGSMICIIISVLCNLAGSMMNLFFIDKHLEKE